MTVWKLRLLGVVLTVVVMQYLSDMGSELGWRRERTVLRNQAMDEIGSCVDFV